MIATSGTAAALWEASQEVRKGKPAAKAKAQADTRSVRSLTTRLTKMNNAQRSGVPGIGPRRSEIVVAGAQVYAALLEKFALPGFVYSPLGMRDGILSQMLAEARSQSQRPPAL